MINDRLTNEEAIKFQLRNSGYDIKYEEYKEDEYFIVEIKAKVKSKNKIIYRLKAFSPESFEDCYRVHMEYMLRELLGKVSTGKYSYEQ